MLTQLSISNYKSIKEEITFSMQATSISEHKDHLINGPDGNRYLPISAIYGPNGSGKSNIVEAVQNLVRLIRLSAEGYTKNEYKNKDIVFIPFSFDEDTLNRPTIFRVFYLTETSEYNYEIHIKRNDIVFETLSQKRNKTKRISKLFERNEKGISLYNSLKGLRISNDISTSFPLLSYLFAIYGKNVSVYDIYNGFSRSFLAVDFSGNASLWELEELKKKPELKEIVLQMIREMDIDVVDIRIEDSEKNDRIFSKHIIDDNEYELPFYEESNGTKKLFSILTFIAMNMQLGTALIIDELDANIHPKLLKHIIEWHTNAKSNINGAQIIFTTHDLANMNKETFRRDEIWFVAKGRKQESILYSLVEFKDKNGIGIRNDAKYNKQYLEGKYGADPFLRKMINWDKISG